MVSRPRGPDDVGGAAYVLLVRLEERGEVGPVAVDGEPQVLGSLLEVGWDWMRLRWVAVDD